MSWQNLFFVQKKRGWILFASVSMGKAEVPGVQRLLWNIFTEEE